LHRGDICHYLVIKMRQFSHPDWRIAVHTF